MRTQDIISAVERKYGLTPGLLASVWQQESGGSDDLGLLGIPTRHGQAVGPFQIMPKWHGPPGATFEEHADRAGKILAQGGKTPTEQLRAYYGTGKPLPGQPTTAEYERQVMARIPGAGPLLASTDTAPAYPPMNASRPEQMPATPQEETQMLGEDTLSTLMGNPLFLMGASILANNGGGRSTGQVLGAGLLGGTAAYQGMQRQKLAERMQERQLKAMENPRSANIAEYEYLRKQGVPHEQAMRYSFAGNAGYGERGMMMGNVPMVQVTRPDGTTALRPMTPEELTYRQDVIGGEKRMASESEDLGKQTAALRAEINKVAMTAPSMIKQTDQLIADIEAGKYQDTGPISGRIKEYWSPDLADLQFKATEQVLQNLQIVNLAPVTIKELELMGQLYAGAYKTPEQNLAVLKYLNGRMKERSRRMRKLDAKLRSGGKIEDLPQWVADEFDPFDEVAPLPDFAPATPAAPTAPVTVPNRPAGMPDDQWQELLRLRGMSGGR